MPNCDFYGVPADHRPILDWIFAENSCAVYELASEFEKPLRRFENTEQVMAVFERRANVHLQLYVIGAGPAIAPKKILLNPDRCGGATFRYSAEGWGLIQLYLSSHKADRLEVSHSNHNSMTRAVAWAPTITDLGTPAAWDFKRITSFSAKINRAIRKRGVAKLGSQVILPGALQLWKRGVSLGPYNEKTHGAYFSE